jgi:Skp family chaperone for outer membrane proteins
MRHALIAASLALITWTSSAQANNVAVADSQAAVLASDIAKKTIDDLNTSLKPQRERLEKLRSEIQGIQEKFQKNGAVLSDKDKKDLQAQGQNKLNEYSSMTDGVQRRIEEAQANMLKTLMPKMEKVVEELRKEGNYDIIIEKKYAIWSTDSVDLTKKITERLNTGK